MNPVSISVEAAVHYIETLRTSAAQDKARLVHLEEQMRVLLEERRVLTEERHKFGSLLNAIGAMATTTDVNANRVDNQPWPANANIVNVHRQDKQPLPVTQEVVVDLSFMDDESSSSSSSVSDESKLKVRNAGFPCKKCSQVLPSRQALSLHTCKSGLPFKCDQCSSVWTERKSLMLHMRVHQNKCPQCNHVFSSSTNLRDHLARGMCKK